MEKNKTRSLQKLVQKQALKYGGLAYALARTGHFALQAFPLPLVDLLATGKLRPAPKEFAGQFAELLQKIKTLHENDLQNIENGIYPVNVLYPENIVKHALRYPQLVYDSYKAAVRRKENKAKEFNEEADDFLQELPDYYKRNFHFQTDGYLSEGSAELYEHQVEILFRGAADAMRRLIIAPMKVHLMSTPKPSVNGEGLNILEVGCGTGRLTRSLAYAFPKAKITCLDLSPMYLAKARERLAGFKNINFVQGGGEDLTFKDQKFDAVVSCFLFHELPITVRKEVISEAKRVLKPGGFFGLVDSIQKNDAAEFQWALKQFPMDFHEPFFKNYVQHPMEDLLKDAGLLNISRDTGLLSKAVSGIKPH